MLVLKDLHWWEIFMIFANIQVSAKVLRTSILIFYGFPKLPRNIIDTFCKSDTVKTNCAVGRISGTKHWHHLSAGWRWQWASHNVTRSQYKYANVSRIRTLSHLMESVTRQTAIVGDPTGDTGWRGVGGTGEGQQSTGSMCIVAEVNHIQFCYYTIATVKFHLWHVTAQFLACSI